MRVPPKVAVPWFVEMRSLGDALWTVALSAGVMIALEHGHLDRLLAGGDTAAARSVTAGPGMPGLLASFGRSIRTVIGLDDWNAITVSNPARAFSLRIR